MKKIIWSGFIVFIMGVFSIANACSSDECNNDGDCKGYAKKCISGKARCSDPDDEDPFKGGVQGCHGHCVCI